MCDIYNKNADHLRIDQNERIVKNSEIDQQWADWLSPTRRSFLFGAGAAAIGLTLGETSQAEETKSPQATASASAAAFAALNGSIKPYVSNDTGVSEWGYETLKQPTVQPKGLWPGTENGLPDKPRAFTDIKSYHAHFYFDQDTFEKAALIRRWAGERFPVELGDWNLAPRGPHVTPSFYFGFTNDLLTVVIPWLQLNSLGLTILVHPNTDDPRADHLYYTLWVNRSQPVNAFNMKAPLDQNGKVRVEKILPNVTPTVKLEV
ncbi:DOPA 4,5-dioxygenase family protein [Silvibacterium sp.]|uniref:DOPA 4,5-dioxygenase family protein n=1 Tax=Silvibacterium sp. TaxID=1964179 RepID=UPI0039E5EE02